MNDSQDAEEDYARTAACRTPRVVYVTSENTRTYANLLPSNRGRSSIVHALIDSLGLLESESDADEEKNEDVSRPEDLSRARVIEPLQMSRSDLCRFHDKEYIEALFTASVDNDSPETSFDSDVVQASPKKRMRLDNSSSPLARARTVISKDEQNEDHGLEHDNPVFQGLEEYCGHIAGGSIAGARELRQGGADIAIFWDGGRHHATKSSAAGFCYINDIVLAILELQKNPMFDKRPSSPIQSSCLSPKRLKKILYIDLDLHHGDGVAEAFETNPNVVTVSLHLWSKGFYPSTPKGHLDYTGPPPPSAASNTTLNIAVPNSGLSGSHFNRLVNECIEPISDAVKPDAVVLQCGVDGLAGDPCKEFNISLKAYGQAVESILSWCRRESEEQGKRSVPPTSKGIYVPVLMLGGGGYHNTNAARAWAYLTSIALDRPYDLENKVVPLSNSHWETFYNDNAQGEGLDIPSHLSKRDENTEEDISLIVERFREYAKALSG